MPSYNVDRYIQDAIDSILNQTYENFELIILDDGSKDKTWKVISEIKDNRVKKFRFKKNKGNIVALNFLLQKAKGEYITFQDADDWSDLNRIKIQVDFLSKHPDIYLCGTDYSYVEDNLPNTEFKNLPGTHEEIINYINLYESPPLCAASCMIQKATYSTIGGLREYFNRIGAGDFDWHYRIIENFTIANVNKTLYFYRKNNFSTTKTITSDIKKMVSEKIAYHLHTQRKSNISDLIDAKNFEKIDDFCRLHLPEYTKDKGLIYFKMAENQIKKQQLRKGFISLIILIFRTPFKRRNLTIMKLLFKALLCK